VSGFGGFCPLPIRLGGSDTEGWTAEQHARAAADLAAAVASVPFAVITFTKSGSSYTLHAYSGLNGMGAANAPTLTSGGTGVTTITFPATHEDEYETVDAVAIRHVRVTGSGATAVIGTGSGVDITEDPKTVIAYTADATGTPIDCKCTVVVGCWTRIARIGHYDGATDKKNADREITPYAALWYDEYTAALGSGFTSARTGLVHCRKLALARMEAGVQRGAEKINANSHPDTCDDMLGEWVKILQLRLRGDETRQEIRQRAAAKFKGATGNSSSQVDEVVSDLLGSVFQANVRTFGTDLATPPTPTNWPGINPGPSAYSLGGGAWLSARSHLTVSVIGSFDIHDPDFAELVNVTLYDELDRLLPAWMTFNWAADAATTGFLLDISKLDFTGFT
jgi:hypothetical protein